MTELRTKLNQLREYMAAGDWRAALKMAASFPRLGNHKEPIERAWAAFLNPGFYESIGRRPDILINAGIDALKARYGDPEKQFSDGELK